MKTKKASVTLSSIKDYVRLMNNFFSLTDMELEVLCEFIKERIRRKRSEKTYSTHLFHHSVKKKISRGKFDRKNYYWMNGYIMKLKEKNALIPEGEDGQYRINKALVPSGENKIVIEINWKTGGNNS